MYTNAMWHPWKANVPELGSIGKYSFFSFFVLCIMNELSMIRKLLGNVNECDDN